MSVTLKPSSIFAPPRTQQSTAQMQKASAPAAPQPKTGHGTKDTFEAQSTNTCTQAQLEKGGWSKPTPVIPQSQADNCGSAVAAMLVRSMGGGQGKTDAQLMQELESKYTDGTGTTPEQLGEMLAGQNLEVERGAATLDRVALDNALRAGHKVVAMVDSNLITPGGSSKGPGSAHWVEIDGMDKNGNYLVNDPATGKSYPVSLQQLTDAMNTGCNSGDSGGMLVVKATNKGAGKGALDEENGKHSGNLGDGKGIGSNSSAAGRESAT